MKTQNASLFIDGTFRCVPSGFHQCLVFMIQDYATDLFIPVFYVLCNGKSQDIYWNAIGAVINACDDKLHVGRVVCDFEMALIDAVNVQFDTTVIGCYFHWKQACRRRMQKDRIPETQIGIAMSPGYLDSLTVIDHDDIAGPGIRRVRRIIRNRCSELDLMYAHRAWSAFWRYFRRTWLKRYSPTNWNVSRIEKQDISRTNNPLERFNREINASIGAPHSSMPRFISVIGEPSQRYAARLSDVRARLAKTPRRRRVSEPWTLPGAIDLSSYDGEDSDVDFQDKSSGYLDDDDSEGDNHSDSDIEIDM